MDTMVSADSAGLVGPGGPEPDGWDEALVRHLPAVRTFVRMNLDRELRSREAVSDLIQSSMREVVGARGRVRWENDEAFRAYLFTCVTNKILDKKRYWNRQKREQGREQSLDSEELQLSSVLRSPASSTPSALFVRGEQIQLLQDAFDRLDEREKKLFSMRFIFGLQPTHIGHELGSPESSVRRELARLQAGLASVLGGSR
jgi:RNA polymerase sigma factor (sigma-70 family)